MAHDDFIAKASEWGSPERLAELVMREMGEVTHEDFFNQPGHQPIKDAWQAAAFALGYQSVAGTPVEVRLASHDRFPDFQIRFDGVEVDFESVMAVTRSLGEQYKGDRRKGPIAAIMPQDLRPFDVGPLRLAVERKVAKNYQGRIHLLVYIETKGAAAHSESVAGAIRDACGDAFESVWVLGFGRPSGTAGQLKFFLLCAKPSRLMAEPARWREIPILEGYRP